jgi:hypothetical protein
MCYIENIGGASPTPLFAYPKMILPVLPCLPVYSATLHDTVYPHTSGVPSDLFTEKFFRIVSYESRFIRLFREPGYKSNLAVDAFVHDPSSGNSSVYARFLDGKWYPHTINGA